MHAKRDLRIFIKKLASGMFVKIAVVVFVCVLASVATQSDKIDNSRRKRESLYFWDDFYENDYYTDEETIILQGSLLGYMGRVEVLLADGTSGSICGNEWDIRDAMVVCRQLGYEVSAVIPTRMLEFGVSMGPVVYSKMRCSGSENSLSECSSEKWDGVKSLSCDRHRVAGAVCGCPKERSTTAIARCFLYTGFPRDDLFCQYRCPRDFVLVGERRRHCSATQKWNEKLPTCVRAGGKPRKICLVDQSNLLPCLRDDVNSIITQDSHIACLRKGCCYNESSADLACFLPETSICGKNPCENGGKCIDYFKSPKEYNCICVDPYYGKNCQFRRNWTCGIQSVQPSLKSVLNFRRIFGGRDALDGSWPWIVQIREAGDFVCAGALIHPEWVVTAAHCIKGRPLGEISKKWQVVAGQHRRVGLDSGSEVILLDEVYITNYRNIGIPKNDIAMLKLKRAVPDSSSIEPICLPNHVRDFPSVGTKCWIAGWGQLEMDVEPDVLQDGDIPIMSNNDCKRLSGPFNNYDMLTDDMFCAGYDIGGVDACSGDSGGPLVCKREEGSSWYLAGIVSWGYKCADANSPGVYTKLSSYLDWISTLITPYTSSDTRTSG